jgi:hypothetical protein
MALQLIYTSASAALKPGVTGFATVAQHRGIRASIVRSIEQRSGYLDSAAHGGKRPPVFAFRRIEAAGERAYVLTRVVASGADYTGRNNHLAHHLVVSEAELENLQLSPADVMLQMKWEDRWDKEPQYFAEAEEIKLSAMKPRLSLPARKWPSWPKGSSWDPACAALPFYSNTESKDARSFFAVNDVDDTGRLLELYGESLLLKDPDRTRPALLWQTPFTTLEIQAEDAKEFQWIGCVHGSPRHSELLKQKRTVIDLTAASLTPPTGELAEIARNPARVARKAPDVAKKAEGAASSLELPAFAPPTADEPRKQRREKKRDYEKDMLAHIEGADVEDKSLRERLMPLVIGVAVIFLGLVAWKVYQDVSINNQKQAAAKDRASVEQSLKELETAFRQPADVSLRARSLSDDSKFQALQADDPLKQRLSDLLKQHDTWFNLQNQIKKLSELQLQLTPADDKSLSEVKAALSQPSLRLPVKIMTDLTRDLGAVEAEQINMKKILSAKEHGVDPKDTTRKFELDTVLKSFARPKVRAGMQQIVAELFPPPKKEDSSTKASVMTQPKVEEKPVPKVIGVATDGNPNIALLQRMPSTYVVPRGELRVSFAAVKELKDALPILTAADAPGSPTVSVAEAGAGPVPAAGILNMLDGHASFTPYKIAETVVYDARNTNVMDFSGTSIVLASSRPLWKADVRYVFAFSKNKPGPEGPLQRFPDLHVLSMPPASTKEEALKSPPLLLLPAADFMMRDGTRIVIKTGSTPDPRKLLGKLLLAAGTESGASFDYEFNAPAAPALKRSKDTLPANGTLPVFASSGTSDAATLWSKVGIDLSAEIQRPAKARQDEIQKELNNWTPLAAGLEALRPGIPANFATLAQAVTHIRRGGKDEPKWVYPPLNPEDDLPVSFPPGLVLKNASGRSAIVSYLDLLDRTITMLESKTLIQLTAEDQDLKLVLKQYAQPTAWINKDAWTTVVATYTALLAGTQPTAKEAEKAKTDPPILGQHRGSNRAALLQWFNGMLSPAMMTQTKDYLTWVPGTDGLDPVQRRLDSETAMKVWLHNDQVAELLEKAPPEKLSAGYTLLLSFPAAVSSSSQQPTKEYFKWIEFTGQPQAAPAPKPSQAPNNKP